MPRSQRPRGRYRPDPRVAAARANARGETRSRSTKIIEGETARPGALVRVGPSSSAPPAPKRLPRYVGPTVAGAAAVGTGAYLLERKRRNRVMKMIDPLTGGEVFVEKRYAADEVEGMIAKAITPDGMPKLVGTSRAPADRSGPVSHANKLSHTRHKPRRNPTGALLLVKRGGRGVSGTSVGKMLGQAPGRMGTRQALR